MGVRTAQGFTAVELLITLFVAVAFLVTSYTMSSLVVNDSGDTRAEIKAAGLAEEYLDRYTVPIGNCVASTPVNNLAETVDGLSAVTVTIRYTCPNSYAPNLWLVEVTVNYNKPQKTVVLSSYAAGE